MSINIREFMSLYKIKKGEEEKEKFVKEHITTEYVPYEKKADYAKAVADASYWINEKMPDGSIDKVLHIDSVAKYMLSCMGIVKLFTDIRTQIGDGKMLEDFNELNKYGILDYIIQNVNQKELKEFNMILQMTCDDVIANEYENHAYFTKQIYRFGNLIGTALAPVIDNVDADRIEEFIKKTIVKDNNGVA